MFVGSGSPRSHRFGVDPVDGKAAGEAGRRSAATQLAAAISQAGDEMHQASCARPSRRTRSTPAFDLLYLQLMEIGRVDTGAQCTVQKVNFVGSISIREC